MNASGKYSRSGRVRTTFIFAGIVGVVISGCLAPDPRTVRGALDAAARAIEAGDGRALFAIIDQRARNAMFSIVHSRTEAARLVSADYPPEERQKARIAMGDAASARDA